LLEGFVTFLHNLAADPARPIHTISLLTHSERQQILVDWNKTHTDYPHDQCIHQLIESQAARTPDAIAIVSRDQHLTYHQLNQRANYLANHLRTLGVGPDMLVGICLERSIEMMVGLLAILKAGGAYVPLDPHYPHDRLALMLEDAQVPVLLTTCHLLEHLPKHHSTLICIDEHKDMREPENPVCTTTPDNLAYIIYTSGSTGTPNGVMIAHRGLVNHAIASMRMFELNPSDRMLQFSSISFDAAAEELFPTWITGGTVVLRTEEMLESFASFIDCVAHYGITILDLPTSFWHAWVTHLEQTPVRLPGSLRLVVVGAEKALVERYRTWCTIVGNSVAWLNTYGPTETTITAMAYAPDGSLDRLSDAGRGSGSVPIGRPLDNVQVYVVDSYLQPVPVGLPGELCISGVGLAHGYLKRPTMTEKRFVANPFVAEPDARMYKTGDMVRYLPDGVVEFLGRIDHQVKIRGFRIELAEIEVSLSHHPGVRDVVVLAREETPGQPYLVAYVVPKPGHNLDTPSLRSFLQEKLPDYMVPSAFVLLDELPLTPNKKIDRRALPAPDFTPCDRETYASPYTHMQKVLAGIWSTVFGNVTVGIHDNFFSLGGDSLQAMQLVAIISTEVGQHISVRDIFIYPTIATLAEALEQRLVTLPQPATTKKERDKHPSVNVNQANGSSSPIQTHTSVPYHTSFTVTIERRSLLSLVAAGQMEPVEAVIIGYQPPLELPMACLEQAGVTQDEVIHGWCDDLPVFYQAIDTYLGRIGVINLPRFENQLYTDKETLVPLIIDGLKLARQVGAKVATLANLLPVMTDGGVLLTPAIEHRTDLPLVTNRQGTTAAALVMGMRRILEEANRDMADERVGFLGLGAFATAALRLALTCLPHPQEILLCDPYSPKARLQQLQHELVVDMGFQGSVRIVETPDTHSSDFYDASMMIITSNLPDILDLNRVYPGTLIMEDLISHGSFNTRLAIQRFERDQDILFTTRATDLLVPQAISATRYLPRLAEPVLSEACLRRFALRHPFNITCCMLSGILSVRFEHLRPTIGPVDVDTCIQHYRTLEEQRFRGFDLYCKDYALPEVLIRTFRQQFGKAATYA
jgi:amino acid adenylation domain-containing protein